MKVSDESYSIPRPRSRIAITRLNHGETYLEGDVLTPHGIVSVYAQGDKTYKKTSRLDFILDGRCYTRTFHDVRYSVRGLVTKAAEFAAEIAKEPPQ